MAKARERGRERGAERGIVSEGGRERERERELKQERERVQRERLRYGKEGEWSRLVREGEAEHQERN